MDMDLDALAWPAEGRHEPLGVLAARVRPPVGRTGIVRARRGPCPDHRRRRRGGRGHPVPGSLLPVGSGQTAGHCRIDRERGGMGSFLRPAESRPCDGVEHDAQGTVRNGRFRRIEGDKLRASRPHSPGTRIPEIGQDPAVGARGSGEPVASSGHPHPIAELELRERERERGPSAARRQEGPDGTGRGRHRHGRPDPHDRRPVPAGLWNGRRSGPTTWNATSRRKSGPCSTTW